MKTWTGSESPLTDSAKVNILDLVVHMGRERRWGGFGSREWTVLHHSLLVTFLWLKAGFPRDGLVYALIHDAHESFTGDIPSPVKKLMGPGVRELEAKMDTKVHAALDLTPPNAETLRQVKVCDLAALVIEAPLFGPPNAWADVPEEFRVEVMDLVDLAFDGHYSDILKNRASVGDR
jgi:5'-deoxynucleotidase YfbR-like HD superfamily hydrolase